nr:MAG TPA: hypothetical protein [Caudoviricetes sp.]
MGWKCFPAALIVGRVYYESDRDDNSFMVN